MKKLFLIVPLIVLVIVFGYYMSTSVDDSDSSSSKKTSEEQTQETETQGDEQTTESSDAKVGEGSAPKMEIDKNKTYTATMKTSLGDIELKLFAKDAPKTVNNFVYLAEKGFYDKTIFHRIIKDFMIQGGDPEGTGMGGPGYQFEDEINEHKLVKGVLAMANAGPDTNGSQFFIVTKESTPELDGIHTAFGEVTGGMDIALKIEGVETTGPPKDKPVEDVVLESIKIDSK